MRRNTNRFLLTAQVVLGLCFGLAASKAVAGTIDSGLIAYYPLDGNANDTSGNGHHGTVVGATPISGRLGGAFHFDGDDSIDVPDSPDFSLGSADFTMALWLKLDVATGNYYAMGHDEGPGHPNSKWIFWVNPGASTFFLHVHGPTIDFNVSSPPVWVADTEWRHLAITREDTLFSFYLDGMLLGVDNNAGAIPDPDTTFQMGTAESGHPERVLRGALDDVRLYNRALSASEVAQLAEQSIDSGLIAYYPLDGNADDGSGNGHNGSIVGATPVGSPLGGAFHFDGDDSIDVPDSPDFSLGSADFTMALWLKLDVATGNYYAMGHDEGPGHPNSKWIFWVNPGASTFFLHVHGPAIDFNVSSPPVWVADTEWRHLAITRDDTLFSFYLDGMLLGVDNNAGAIPDPDTTFQMGTAESGHPERVLRGALDDVRLYNRALSASEVAQLAEQWIFYDGFELGDTSSWTMTVN